MIVSILLVEHLFEKELRLRLEISDDLVVLVGRNKLPEFVQDAYTTSGIIRVLSVLEVLNLHEKGQKLVETFHNINIDLQQGLQSLMALSEFVHGREVDGVPTADVVLLSKNFSVSSNNVASVLLKKTHESKVEFAMALDGVRIVLHSLYELSLFDVHGLHSETTLFLLKLVVHHFLEAHALEAEQADQAVVVALISQDVVGVQAVIINVQLVEDHV